MSRCANCILPNNYPGISFDESRICNHCVNYKRPTYLGMEAMKKEVEAFLMAHEGRNADYDCVLGLSGGRDSAYLLYLLEEVADLRVLAYSVDNGFVPEQTKENLRVMTGTLGVKLVIEDHELLRKCIRHHMASWMMNPSPAMVGLLCTGCRLNMDAMIKDFAARNGVPVIVRGGTPFEGQGYKFNIMRTDPNSRGMKSFVLGYLSNIMRNPMWILNTTCLTTQVREFYYHYYRKIHRREDQMIISPFWSYIEWREEDVIKTIENKLGWKKNPNTESTWRGDCDIALLKLYLYKKTLGFNDKDDGLSSLIRDGQITRDEALDRLEKEGDVPEEAIVDILDKMDLKYSNLEAALGET